MKALANLQNSLSGFGNIALKEGFAPPDELRRYTQALEKRFGAADSDKPRLDRMEPALRRLLDSGLVESERDIRYICYGLAHPVGSSKQRVLGSQEGFGVLVKRIQSLTGDTKRLRRCYQGLMSTYFEFDGRTAEEPTQKQWYEVRNMLDRQLDAIVSTDPVPQWALALNEHRNLLSDFPCKRYSRDLLSGVNKEFDYILAALGISDKSWVLREGAFSAIHAACDESDAGFLVHVPALLDLMHKHPLIQVPALAAVLSRYAKMRSHPVNKRLCDFSIVLWGNPLLKKNLRNWDIVGEAVTQLIGGWLKLRLIEDFFELLSVDGKTDKRRVRFWQRYIDSIDDIFFALGRNAYFRNDDEDIKQLRKTMGDNLLRLDGGSSSNNGFFMVMGDKVVAEFGEMGNAVYVFRNDSMPFELKGSINGTGRTEWRELKGAHHLRHQDNVHGYQKWEGRFDSYFRKNVGISPGKPLEHKPHASTTTAQLTKEEIVEFGAFSAVKAASNQAPLPSDVDTIRKFCVRYGMRFDVDSARRRLIVHTGNSNSIVSEYPNSQAFAYSTADACWFRSY